MRDMTERAQEDRKIVIKRDGAAEPYDATHWAGQWSGAEPPAKPDRADVRAAPGAREAPPGRRDQRGKPSQAALARRRRRHIALAAGVAAVGLLLVAVIPELDQSERAPLPRAGLAQSQISNAASLPRTADPVGTQGPEPRIAEALQPAIQRSPGGEQVVATAPGLIEARRVIETLTAQLRTQATRNDHELAQERERTATRDQEAEAARKELAETSARQRQVIEQERASGATLASQLAASRQEGEALAAQLRKAATEAGQSKQADAARTAQSLEQEQQKAAALTEAETARRELTATAAQQRQMLEQEHARGAALANQMSVARQDNEALAAQLRKAVSEAAQLKQSEAAKSAQLLQLEQQKQAALTEVEAARQALTATGAEQRQTIEQERTRGIALAKQVAAARQDNEALAGQLRKATGETAQLKQADAAKSAQILQLEQQKVAALAEVEAARQALTAAGAEQRQALEQERTRNAALATQASMARRDGEALAVQLRQAQDEISQSRQAAETTIAELRQTLQQERDRAAAMTLDSRSARFGVSGPTAIEPAAISQAPRQQPEVMVVAEAEQPVVAAVDVSQEALRLITRASALLGQGDIGSARIVLERATEMGSARASFMLAETYDPRILSAWGTYGTRGEVARARELYAKAQAGGIQEAKERVGALLR